MRAVFLLAFLLLGVAMGRHTKKHGSRDMASDVIGAISGAMNPGEWPSPGSLGGFGVPSGLLPGLGNNNGGGAIEGASGATGDVV